MPKSKVSKSKKFREFSRLPERYVKNNYLKKNPQCVWPVTEIAIPSILHFLEGQDATFSPPLIEVPKDKKVPRQVIDRLLKKGEQFGLKKIGRDTDSEAFQHLMHLQAQAAGEA